MPDDIRNWKELSDMRTMQVAEVDQLSAKIYELSIDARCVSSLTDQGVSDSILCNERNRIAEEHRKALDVARVLIHRRIRLDRAEQELRREEARALQAALEYLDAQAETNLKGGLD